MKNELLLFCVEDSWLIKQAVGNIRSYMVRSVCYVWQFFLSAVLYFEEIFLCTGQDFIVVFEIIAQLDCRKGAQFMTKCRNFSTIFSIFETNV